MNNLVDANHLRQMLVVAKLLRQLSHEDPIFEEAAAALEQRARRIALGEPDVPHQGPVNVVC